MTAMEMPRKPRVHPRCEQQGYATLETESAGWIDPSRIRGQVPAHLNGTLYLSCVGRNSIGGQKFGHWFDGDGMINAVTLNNGKVHYQNRYVRTEKFVRESEAQRILYRGVGTQVPGGMLKNMFRTPGNAANTNVILHGGKLLALWEGGKPYELDPATLETIGEYDFGGGIKSGQPFSAHPRLDPRTGDLYNFGVFGVPKPKLHFYRVNAQGDVVANNSQYVGDYAMCHDFVITDRHAIFVLCPAFMRHPFKFLFGRSSIMESIEFDPSEKTKIIVLELETAKIVGNFDVPTFFGFHVGNGFAEGEKVSLDVLCVDNMDVMGGLSDVTTERGDDFDFLENGTVYRRFTLDLAKQKVSWENVPGAIAGEFPVWHSDLTGLKHRYTWLGTIIENGTPYGFNAYQKIDHETGTLKLHDFGEGRFTSEANFVPGGGAAEDDGYLMSIVYNHARGKSEIVLLDAKDMREEVAVIELDHHVPFGFHGNFYPETFV